MKKRLITLFALVIAYTIAISYIIPSFNIKVLGKEVNFTALPSLRNNTSDQIDVNLPGSTYSYRYEIRNVVAPENAKDRARIIGEDINVLTKRLSYFLQEDSFEIRSYEKDNQIYFQIFTNESLDTGTGVLTIPASNFEITSIELLFSADPNTGPTTSQARLNLSRNNFGNAELIEQPIDSTSSYYIVKMPLGILSPSQINEIREVQSSSPSIRTKIGNTDYTSQFQYATDANTFEQTPISLGVASTDSKSEALSIVSILNTGSLSAGYEIVETEQIIDERQNEVRWMAFILILAIAVFGLAFFYKNLNLKKAIVITLTLLLGAALVKALGQSISLGYLIIISVLVMFSLFGEKMEYFLVLLFVVLISKLFGVIDFVDISWGEISILLAQSAPLISIKDVKRIEKKYQN